MLILEQNSQQLKLKLGTNSELVTGSFFLIIGVFSVFFYALIFTNLLSIDSFKYSSKGATIFLIGSIFIILGLSYLIRDYPESCDFDKSTGKFTLNEKSFLSGIKTTEYLLADIATIKMVLAQIEDPHYYISLITESKKEINLTTRYNSAPQGNPEIAQQISDFLSISLTR
ncbi:MAG: hypothetical protein HCA25_00580 (plasmid) [Dolichospermum sp. DET50]|nr:hypothetical protein [Dolichospermum sp. DET66]MBS3035997.1 hypothetical protein [Dolichospermum sp. DET67]MBS3041165.1 hypothetical protein [Dolichospermum sp. DET50]QSX70905.1 MAG: hypothetical protein EZY12_27305 [Dolichospermum sp. DET69]